MLIILLIIMIALIVLWRLKRGKKSENLGELKKTNIIHNYSTTERGAIVPNRMK